MQQTSAERRALAYDAAYHSALISGSDVTDSEEGSFRILIDITTFVLGCETGMLTHPLIINMALCGHQDRVHYRKAIRASVRTLVPDAKHIETILKAWWDDVESTVPKLCNAAQDVCERYAWEQHDFLVSLEPFADANGRTARTLYYNLQVSLGATVKIISSEKANAYSARQREYRRDVFAPKMRARGFIAT